MKRIVFVMLLLTAIAQGLSAQTKITLDGIIYALYSSTDGGEPHAEVTGNNLSEPTDLVLPDFVTNDGVDYRVTIIGTGAFRNCEDLTSVKLPKYLDRIENYAFYGSGVSSTDLGNSVSHIGTGAFYNCNEIKTIIFPPSVKSNGDNVICSSRMVKYAYPNTMSMTVSDPAQAIVYPADDCIIDNDVIYNSDKSAIYYAPIGKSGDFVIPGTVKSIKRSAFYKCSYSSIAIPDKVETIDAYAFGYCRNLIYMVIPPSAMIIDNNAFLGCEVSLKAACPIRFKSIFKVSNETIFYPNEAISDDGLIYDRHKNGLYYVPLYVDGLLTIPETVTEIGHAAFMYCDKLTKVEFGNNVVTKIGDKAFYKCTKLENITGIGDKLSFLGKSAFESCKALKTPCIDQTSIIEIPARCFFECENIDSINIPSSVTGIGNSALSSTGITLLNLPDNLSIIEDSVFTNCKKLSSITFPNSLTTIKRCAFYGCEALGSIKFPSSLTVIEDYAFRYCTSLPSVEFPDGLTKIGFWAFQHCPSIKSVYIPGTLTYPYGLGWCTFENSENIKTVYYNTQKPVDYNNPQLFNSFAYACATLYVPRGRVWYFKNDNYIWCNFKHIEEFDFTSGIDDVIADGESSQDTPVEYYNLQGVRVANPTSGLYIERRGNKARMVMIK